MNTLGFRSDIKITDVIGTGKFTLSAEIIPPRNGTEQEFVFHQIASLVEKGAEFLSVTKGAGGSLRGGSLPIAQAIKERFHVPCIAHFTCRDLTPQDVENQLMDHHYFGIRNILALRGDPPQDQPNWEPIADSYSFAYQLIEQIQGLNQGVFLPRGGKSMRGEKQEFTTDFCIGAAAYPEHPNAKERVEFFSKKVSRGADYAITQMLYDPVIYSRFLEELGKAKVNVPVLVGTRMVKTQKQALSMAKRFGVSISQDLLKQLPEVEAGPIEQLVDIYARWVEEFKRRGAPGIHLFVLSDSDSACQLLGRLAKS